MRTHLEARHLPTALVLLTLFSAAATTTHAQPLALESYRQTFYPGLTVTSQRLASGDLTATVEDTYSGRPRPRAVFRLSPVRGVGEWTVHPSAHDPGALEVFRYTSAPDFDSAAVLRQHNARSIALSALLLWEDHEAERAGLAHRYGDTCPTCRPDSNGCSGWFETCNGHSITQLCNRHDTCYQCGATCDGTNRAQCDAQFRAEVRTATGSSWCSLVYWLGVRGLGWLFYQNPEYRTDMQPDVYGIGVAISACPTAYSHLCTIYVY